MPETPLPYCSEPRCPNRKPCPIHRTTLSSEAVRLRGRRGVRRRHIKLARNPICENCGIRLAEQVDHRTPLSHGGAEDWTNLSALCKNCHAAKTRQERNQQKPWG